MPFDFSYDEYTDFVLKKGHYSRCEPHEATREEALLWKRVQELETLLDAACPPEVHALLSLLANIPYGISHIEVNEGDFEGIRQYARHRVEVDPIRHRESIVGCFQRMVDGSPSSVWISVNREVPQGSITVEPANDAGDAMGHNAEFVERRVQARAEERRLSKYDRK